MLVLSLYLLEANEYRNLSRISRYDNAQLFRQWEVICDIYVKKNNRIWRISDDKEMHEANLHEIEAKSDFTYSMLDFHLVSNITM